MCRVFLWYALVQGGRLAGRWLGTCVGLGMAYTMAIGLATAEAVQAGSEEELGPYSTVYTIAGVRIRICVEYINKEDCFPKIPYHRAGSFL